MPFHRPRFLRLILLTVSFAACQTAPAAAAGKVSVLRNVAYETSTGPRKMDLYLPDRADLSPAAPCVIWMGKSGSSAREESVCGDLAGAGFVVAQIDYEPVDRPSDEPVMTGKCAVRFIRSSAAKFGVDERRIAIAGSSQGGAYALLVGLTREEPRFAVKDLYPGVSDHVGAVVTLSAVTDLRPLYGDLKGWPAEHVEELRLLSPVAHVTANAPAVLLFHGTNDKTIGNEHATNLKKLLAQHRVPHRLVMLDRVGHAYSLTTTNGRPLPVDVKDICVTFLRIYLAEAK